MVDQMSDEDVNKFIDGPLMDEGQDLNDKKEDKGFINGVKKFYNKTVIPDMMAEKKELKKLKREAKLEAMKELKPELVKKMKQDELDKLSGKKKKDFIKKLAKGFEGVGNNMDSKITNALGTGNTGPKTDVGSMMGVGQGGMFSEEKMKSLLGSRDTGIKPQQNPLGNAGFSDEKMNQLLGNKQQNPLGGNDKINQMLGNNQKQSNQKQETAEEKLKRMIG